jgi:hypothetical protein
MTPFGQFSSRSLRAILVVFPLVAGFASCNTSDSAGSSGGGGSSGSGTSTGIGTGGGSGTDPTNASGGVNGTSGLTGTGGTPGTGGVVATGGKPGTGGSGTGGQSGVDAAADGMTDVSLTTDTHDLAELCTSTGGALDTGLCCNTAGDFPNSCLVGACGCSPDNSHTVVRCTCPNNSCFTPDVGCGPRATGSDGAVGSGGSSGSGGSGGKIGMGGAVGNGGTNSVGGTSGTGSGTGGSRGTGGGSGSDGGSVDVLVSTDAQGSAALCVSSGGQISNLLCCNSASDFPDSCLGGACGCAPDYSHTIAVCTCPTSQCFSLSTGCVPR